MVLYNSIIYCMVLIQEQRMGSGTCYLIKGARQHQHAKFNSEKIAKLVTCGHICNVELCSSTFFFIYQRTTTLDNVPFCRHCFGKLFQWHLGQLLEAFLPWII
jgi:hypothetical protein